MKKIAVVLYLLLNFFLVIVGMVTGGTVSAVVGCFGILVVYLWSLQDAIEAKKVINVRVMRRPQWIAMDEQRPSEEENVVVMGYDGSVAIARRVGDGWVAVDDVAEVRNGGIRFPILLPPLDWVPTHWMPLPQLPEVVE